MRPVNPLRIPSVAVAAWLVCGGVAVPASADDQGAQDPPSTAVLQVETTESADRGLAGAVERVLRAQLDNLGVVDVAGTPALGLEDLQLAVGCVGDTPACLKAIASQLEVEALLLSTLDRAGGARVLTITFFDTRTGQRESVARREEGPRAANRLLEGIEAQLRELFGLPAPEKPKEPGLDEAGEAGGAAAEDRVDEGPGLPVLPFVMGGIGVAAIATAGALVVKAQDHEDTFKSIDITNSINFERALAAYDKSSRMSKSAYGLFAVGGAALATGAVLFFVMRDGGEAERPPEDVAVVPTFGPGTVGLRLSGQFGRAQ